METKKYSLPRGLIKVLIQVAIFGIPMVMQLAPQAWLNLTIGGVLSLTLNYIKVKWSTAYGS